MSPRDYAIVWIGHNAADIFRIKATEESKRAMNSHTSLQSVRQRGHADGREHCAVDTGFFARITSTLNHVGRWRASTSISSHSGSQWEPWS